MSRDHLAIIRFFDFLTNREYGTCFENPIFLDLLSLTLSHKNNFSINQTYDRITLPFLSCEEPSTSIVILGIELDSTNQIARLPADKLATLQ